MATLTPLSSTCSREDRVRTIGSPVTMKKEATIAWEEAVKLSGTPSSSCTHRWLKKAVR